MLLKIKLTLAFCILFFISWSQVNFCECCSYFSLQYKHNELATIFPPEIIKKNGYKELIINVVGRKRSDSLITDKVKAKKVLISEYREMKILFDFEGYVSSIFWYNRMGKPHSLFKFKRNAAGKVIEETTSYLDSLETEVLDLGSEVKTFSYDSKNNLTKIKKSDGLPDDKSEYTSYMYNSNNKLVGSVYFIYFEGMENSGELSSSTIARSIKYNEKDSTSEEIIKINGKENQIQKTIYNAKGIAIEENVFGFEDKKLYSKNTFKYDANMRLIRFEEIKSERMANECPETKGFLDKYFYNSDGLIKSLIHSFDNKTCEMLFDYKK